MSSAFIWASKCSRGDLDAFSLLWHSLAFLTEGGKKRRLTHLGDELKRLKNAGFTGNFLPLSHTNEINTFCQSQLLPEVSPFNVALNHKRQQSAVNANSHFVEGTSRGCQLLWTFLHSRIFLNPAIKCPSFFRAAVHINTPLTNNHNIHVIRSLLLTVLF